MGLAQALGLPVVLVGDINRGHVIASLVGAHVVLDAADRAMIRGFIVNKFRGNPRLFEDGVRRITELTGWPSIGVVPWLRAASRLPPEDGMQLEDFQGSRGLRSRVKIAVPQLSRIANFDDFDPLREEPDVELVFVPPGRPLPRDAALIVIPGTKSTIADMEFMRSQGWDIDVLAHVRHGGRVLGICGGYQMLGRSISDPDGIEGSPRTVPGLGLLDVETVMTGDKTLRDVSGTVVGVASPFAGYEMHVGSTTGAGASRPFLRFSDESADGAVSTDGRIAGCYVHGLFGVTTARAALLSAIGAAPSQDDHAARVDAALDEIAAELERCLDIEALAAIAGI
jgi:adenosylcobyric acid synthase